MVEIEERCAALIRQLRKKKGLTLRQCEESSGGQFKAVVMGSYERGTRAISLERLQEIADFYGVPIQYFFSDAKVLKPNYLERCTFDLRKLRNSELADESFVPIAHLLAHLAKKRSDWNGEVLSIRRSDSDLLPLITNDDEIFEKLEFHSMFFQQKN